ncbi:MAG: 4Fe-4S dicluster domain-containing protein, partial [Ruminococcus sp.]|nr:4Fe-4S dicluster domain-containing protein [Ruminococcus sp.]
IYKLNIIICLKSTNSENINKLMECLGMYPNIKLNIVPSLYLLGNETILKDYLKIKNDSQVIKASDFYHIYNLIERNRVMNDKLITISGNGLFNPSIIRVKIGTKLDDVVKEMIKLKKVELTYILDGLMSGKKVNSLDNIIITDDFTGLLIMEKKEEKKSGACLNCGACLDICPVNINPLLLNDNNYLNKVKDKCLNCGLCSYICPSYINFNTYLRGEESD